MSSPSIGPFTSPPRTPASTVARVAKADNAMIANVGAAESGDRVSLSPAGLQQAKAASKDENQDIDDSGLPDALKHLLKLSRRLKAQLQERNLALQKVMSDSGLGDEERSLQARQLQAEIGTLNGALATVMKQFAKAMKEADLSQEQAAKVAELLA